jgi:Cu+-exporting ATPase
VGISISEANSVAINTADVVLVGESLRPLVTAHRLSRETLATIKQNLFWAFSYNIVSIPIAMAGMLSPAWAAMAMGFSDVILVLNSLRLKFKRID